MDSFEPIDGDSSFNGDRLNSSIPSILSPGESSMSGQNVFDEFGNNSTFLVLELIDKGIDATVRD